MPLSLPADSRTSYSCLKRELLAQADSRSDATVQVFWEHRKPKGRTWREEAASLTKLARRCAASDDSEPIRQIFIMEQLAQQLPESIVRERKPSSLDQLLDLILTYFVFLDETTWEPKEKSTSMKNISKQMTSHAHSGANVSTKTTTSESSNHSGCDAACNSNSYNRDRRNRQAQESHTLVPRHTGTPGRTSRTSSATTASR